MASYDKPDKRSEAPAEEQPSSSKSLQKSLNKKSKAGRGRSPSKKGQSKSALVSEPATDIVEEAPVVSPQDKPVSAFNYWICVSFQWICFSEHLRVLEMSNEFLFDI